MVRLNAVWKVAIATFIVMVAIMFFYPGGVGQLKSIGYSNDISIDRLQIVDLQPYYGESDVMTVTFDIIVDHGFNRHGYYLKYLDLYDSIDSQLGKIQRLATDNEQSFMVYHRLGGDAFERNPAGSIVDSVSVEIPIGKVLPEYMCGHPFKVLVMPSGVDADTELKFYNLGIYYPVGNQQNPVFSCGSSENPYCGKTEPECCFANKAVRTDYDEYGDYVNVEVGDCGTGSCDGGKCIPAWRVFLDEWGIVLGVSLVILIGVGLVFLRGGRKK